jgi:hypothetical protein
VPKQKAVFHKSWHCEGKSIKMATFSSLSQKHIEIVVIHFLNITKAYFIMV